PPHRLGRPREPKPPAPIDRDRPSRDLDLVPQPREHLPRCLLRALSRAHPEHHEPRRADPDHPLAVARRSHRPCFLIGLAPAPDRPRPPPPCPPPCPPASRAPSAMPPPRPPPRPPRPPRASPRRSGSSPRRGPSLTPPLLRHRRRSLRRSAANRPPSRRGDD